MGKEKKQNYSNQNNNNKNNRNIKKESPLNQRGNAAKQQRSSSNPRDTNRKKGSHGGYNEYELPPIKSKQTNYVQPPGTSAPLTSSTVKKITTARFDQVNEVLTHLSSLQNLLNSYQQLQMDENNNLKLLVDLIMQKRLKSQ